ncbi:DUF4185 domain-containing protein [Streptomyces montanus]|uniref:DUF4185 domain-containing protein n=1 Tax=Streptomyces montanus TaxID=2580423 RepID=A0A5R9FD63_9ACTN|nr:DUF4185 domain-containing protein [Streptomyces montanus]TLS41091.1 DUF4185 domain-containing protein [Streptomyces montanus]
MPDDTRARHRTGAGLGLLLALVLGAALLTALPDEDDDREGGCSARTVTSWAAEPDLTGEFARYGDDASRTDDWTGGDGTHSVRLPDGRVLWLFSDTYLGQVHGPPNPVGESYAWRDQTAPLVRNSAVVMSDGHLRRTLPAPLFQDPAPGQWRWPVAARVESRSPGSSEQVVRVLLWTRTSGAYPWIYGMPTATEVATLSLPDLRVEGIVKVLDQQQVPDPARRVLFGTTAVAGDRNWTYVFGGDDGQAASRPASKAYVARVPRDRLAEPDAWQYWDGTAWSSTSARMKPVLGDGRRKGVGSAFTVVRDGGTWVLFTMAAGAEGLTTVTSYWACSPTGPWRGPAKGFSPPLPEQKSGVAAYNPQVHPALGGRLVLSYDVNWLDATGTTAQSNLSRNVSLYRPRFVTLRLGRG